MRLYTVTAWLYIVHYVLLMDLCITGGGSDSEGIEDNSVVDVDPSKLNKEICNEPVFGDGLINGKDIRAAKEWVQEANLDQVLLDLMAKVDFAVGDSPRQLVIKAVKEELTLDSVKELQSTFLEE